MYANQDLPAWLTANSAALPSLPPFAVSAQSAPMNVHAPPFLCVPPSLGGSFAPPFGGQYEFDGVTSYADLANASALALVNSFAPSPLAGTKFNAGGIANGNLMQATANAAKLPTGGIPKAALPGCSSARFNPAQLSNQFNGYPIGSAAFNAALMSTQPKAIESSAPEHILFESNVEGIVVALPKGESNDSAADGGNTGKRESAMPSPGRLMYECSGESFYLSFDQEDVLPIAYNVLSKLSPSLRREPREVRIGDRVSFSVLMHRFKGDARATKIRVTMASLLNDAEKATQRGADGDSIQRVSNAAESHRTEPVSGDDAPNQASSGSPTSINSTYSALIALAGMGSESDACRPSVAGNTQSSDAAMRSLALRKFRGTICVVRDKFGFIERGRDQATRNDKNIFFHFSEFQGPVSLLRVGQRVEFQISIVNSASNGPRLCAVNVKPAELTTLSAILGASNLAESSNQGTPLGSAASSPQRAMPGSMGNPQFAGSKPGTNNATNGWNDTAYVPSSVELAAFDSMRRFIDAHATGSVATADAAGVPKQSLSNGESLNPDANTFIKTNGKTHIGVVVNPFVRSSDNSGAALNGSIVLKSDGQTQNVVFGEMDQCGSYLLLPGDLVQFELVDEFNAGSLNRATRIRLLKSTFEHTHERRRRGVVSALNVALDHDGKLCGHGRIMELQQQHVGSSAPIEYPFTLNELVDSGSGSEQPMLRLEDLVEFSIAKFDVDHAVRIIRTTAAPTSQHQPASANVDESVLDAMRQLGSGQPNFTSMQMRSTGSGSFDSKLKSANNEKQVSVVRKQPDQPGNLERRCGIVVALVASNFNGSDDMHVAVGSSAKLGFGFVEFTTHEGEIYFPAKACVAADDSLQSNPALVFRSLQLGDLVEMLVQPPLMSTKEAKLAATNSTTSTVADALALRENDKSYTRPSAVALRKMGTWPFGSPEQPIKPSDLASIDLVSESGELRLCETAFWEGTFVGFVRKQMKTCMSYPGIITVVHATARSASDVNMLNATGVGFTPMSFLRTALGQQLTLNVGDRVSFRVVQVRESECLAAAERAAEGKKNCRPVAFAYRAMFVEVLERRTFRGHISTVAKLTEPQLLACRGAANQIDESAIGSITFNWPSDLRASDVPSSLLPDQASNQLPSAEATPAIRLTVAYASVSPSQSLASGDEIEFALMYSNSLKRYLASDIKKLHSHESLAQRTSDESLSVSRGRPSVSSALPPRLIGNASLRVSLSRQPRGPPESSAKGFDSRSLTIL